MPEVAEDQPRTAERLSLGPRRPIGVRTVVLLGLVAVVVAGLLVGWAGGRAATRPIGLDELRASYRDLGPGYGRNGDYLRPDEPDDGLSVTTPARCQPLTDEVLTAHRPVGSLEGVSNIASAEESAVRLFSYRFAGGRQAKRAFASIRMAAADCTEVAVGQPSALRMAVTPRPVRVPGSDDAVAVDLAADGYAVHVTVARFHNILSWQYATTAVGVRQSWTDLIDLQIAHLRHPSTGSGHGR